MQAGKGTSPGMDWGTDPTAAPAGADRSRCARPAPEDRPLRVALLVHDFPVVSETFVINQAAGLLARGHDVTILAMDAPGPAAGGSVHGAVARHGLAARVRHPVAARLLIGDPATDPLRRTAAGRALRAASTALSRALTLLVQPRFDIVHCQFASLGGTLLRHTRAGSLRTRASVVHLRGNDVSGMVAGFGRDYYRDLFARADLMIANCAHFRQRGIDLGADPEKVIVVGSAIDCTLFAPKDHPAASAADGTTGDTTGGTAVDTADATAAGPHLVAVGRLVEKKGLEYAIRAVARLAPAHPGVRLEVIGEGALRPDLERLVADLGLGAHVRLPGAMAHEAVVARLAAADILLAPSVTAASGDQDAPVNTLKEAMAVGLPVIGTRHGGIPELIEDGVSGYLVPERDGAALAAAVERLVAERHRWAEMGRAGRARVLADYDLEVVTDRLVAAYRRLLDPKDAEPAFGPTPETKERPA